MVPTCHDYYDMVREDSAYERHLQSYYCSGKTRKDKTTRVKLTRKRFSQQTKAEIRIHHDISNNFRETGRAFNLDESTVRKICKSEPITKKPRMWKGNAKGGGRPLSYPREAEEQILVWALEMVDNHMPLTMSVIQKKAVSVIQCYNSTFNASKGWVQKFMRRNKLILRHRIPLSQQLPIQLESKICRFLETCARYMKLGQYPLELVGNMDETPLFFDIASNRRGKGKGENECIVRTCGHEKKHVTVILTVTGDGGILPPVIVFKGTTNRNIKDLIVPDGFVVLTQGDTWVNEDIIHAWLDNIWLKYVRSKCWQLGKAQSMIVYDTFKPHLAESVKTKLITNNVALIEVPGGCTSKTQPLTVSVSKPFKIVLRELWTKYLLDTIKNVPEGQMHDPKYKWPSPSKQDIIDWVTRGYLRLKQSTNFIRKSFEVAGVTTTDKSKIRNDNFFYTIMENVNQKVNRVDYTDIDDIDAFQL